ncbi:hypothetical protein HPB48_005178 [Haemaphysalis longicornis]|uniref:RNase H type-1 domain-containing protein n=1 Tax=Haemaphysalis longicornis TaxID=44386 RepID=A0A9J6FFC2_HAELO|nr:hypothetical protein HPB48_005178 [Haemaphysalis longicornis]
MNIVSDSQNACRQWAGGRIGKTAHRLAIGYKSNNPIKIIWAPGHENLEGNQQAHAWTRASLPRADSPQTEFPVPVMPIYSEILSYYKETRIKFPHPHPKLQRQDQTALRSNQTNTFPHLSRLHKLYPTQHPNLCPKCNQVATLYHTAAGCHKIHKHPLTEEQWSEALSRADYD